MAIVDFLLVAHCYLYRPIVLCSSYLTLNNHDPQIWLRGHSEFLEMFAWFDTSRTTSCFRSIVTMALSCVISELKQYFDRKLPFFTSLYLTLPLGGLRRNTDTAYGTDVVTRRWKNFNDRPTFSHFDTIQACDSQTDGQTSCDGTVRSVHSIARQKFSQWINQTIHQFIESWDPTAEQQMTRHAAEIVETIITSATNNKI